MNILLAFLCIVGLVEGLRHSANESEQGLWIEKPSQIGLGEDVKMKIPWECNSTKFLISFDDKEVGSCTPNDDGCPCSVNSEESAKHFEIKYKPAVEFTIKNISANLQGIYEVCESNTRTCENPKTEEININECKPNPCLNCGKCTDGINDFTCACVAGYQGKKCEININECDPNPCLNGGKCTDGINDFTCACVAGYNGKKCEINGEKKCQDSQNSSLSAIMSTLFAIAIFLLIFMMVCCWRKLISAKQNNKHMEVELEDARNNTDVMIKQIQWLLDIERISGQKLYQTESELAEARRVIQRQTQQISEFMHPPDSLRQRNVQRIPKE